MKVYKYLKKDKQWTQFDNNVFTISNKVLLDGAKVLYGFLGGWKANGREITQAYTIKCLGISDRTYMKYIKQLKDLDLLTITRTGPKTYDCFIGTTAIPASRVKEYWTELTADDSKGPLTLEDLENMRKQ